MAWLYCIQVIKKWKSLKAKKQRKILKALKKIAENENKKINAVIPPIKPLETQLESPVPINDSFCKQNKIDINMDKNSVAKSTELSVPPFSMGKIDSIYKNIDQRWKERKTKFKNSKGSDMNVSKSQPPRKSTDAKFTSWLSFHLTVANPPTGNR